MAELLRRLRYLFQQRRLQRELADDIEFHREMAARSGNRDFGNVLRMQEQAREAWGWMWTDRLMQDLHYAGRITIARAGLHSRRCARSGHRHRSESHRFQSVQFESH